MTHIRSEQRDKLPLVKVPLKALTQASLPPTVGLQPSTNNNRSIAGTKPTWL